MNEEGEGTTYELKSLRVQASEITPRPYVGLWGRCGCRCFEGAPEMPSENATMTLSDLLSEVKSRGIRIYLDGDRVRCQSSREVLTPELRSALGAYKFQLIALLSRNDRQQAPPMAPVPRGKPLPLSFAQQRLWLVDQLEPGNSAYNMTSALRLIGRLDVDALNRSFNEVIRRHEALRTTFDTIDGKPVQVIHRLSEMVLRIVDLGDWAESEREEEVKRLLQQDAEIPFNLTKGPLLRTTLFRVNERVDQPEYVLQLTMHHIVSDDWSVAILFREVALVYDAFRKGWPSPLSPLWIQYADFACWQRQWLQGEILERQLTYWKNRLAGSLPRLSLPTIRSTEALSTYEADVHDFLWPSDLAARLKNLSLQNGVTLYMILLAAFQLLLYRYTGQRDICIGTPIANRNRVDIESIVGFFVNTLVLRTDLSGNPSFAQLLKRVGETALGAQMHQDLPFDRLVEELQPVRDLKHSPFFQIMFVLHNVYFEEPEIPGIRTSLINGIKKSTPFDLTLHFAESQDGLRGWFEFKSHLFGRAFVRQMEKNLRVIAEYIVTDPQCRLSEVPVLTEAERHQLLVEWNATEVEYPQGRCLHELFEEQVERTPEGMAVVCEGEALTYAELNARANRLAHYLRSLGVGPEVLVGICVKRSLGMVIGILGILKAGGAYVPIDPGYPRQRIAFMVEDAGPRVVLTHGTTQGVLPDGVRVLDLDTNWGAIGRWSDQNPSLTGQV